MLDLPLSNIAQHVDEYYSNLPHPNALDVKVKEYPSFARVAMLMKDALPDGQDVSHAYHMLKNAEVTPAQFEATWKVARPLANRLLGRDPDIHDIVRLKDSNPGDVHAYYHEHPHPDFPEVKAGDFARHWHAAEPIARSLAGRPPVPREVARFAISGYDAEAIAAHYDPEQGW